MNKKMILFAALVAASGTALVSCSSNDEDVLAQEPVAPVAEQTVVEAESDTVVKGTPVKVILDGTRADLSNTTTANLSSIQLYGVQQTTVKNFWMDNVQFTKTGTEWGAASNPTWPLTNKETVTNFYGFADGVTNGIPAGVTPSITADAQSFTFTFGAGSESSQWFAKWSDSEGSALYNAAWTGMKTSMRNANLYKSSATVLNNANLTDLLVTKDDVSGTEGTDGSLTVNFKHALSNLIIRAMFVGEAAASQWPNGTKYYIQWIRVHGLYHTATYTFGTGWSIDLTNDSRDCAYEHVWGESDSANPDPRWTMDIVPYSTYNPLSADDKKKTYVDIVPAGEFMVIPQTISSYKIVSGSGGSSLSAAKAANQCYIEMYGYFHLGTQTNAYQYDTNGQVHYYPLILNNAEEQTDGSMQSTFVAGKKHVVVIDLTSVLMNDGTFAASPSQAGGNNQNP